MAPSPPGTLTLISAGSNAQGQLANGSIEDSHTLQPCTFHGHPPGALPTGTRSIECIATGANHTLALLNTSVSDDVSISTSTTRRELWGCGTNAKGQLGPTIDASGTYIFRHIVLPLDEIGLTGSHTPRLIAASWETSYIVFSPDDDTDEGSDILISMGANDYGDLGISSSVHSRKPARGRSTPSATRVPPSPSIKPFHVVSFSLLILPDGLSLEDSRRLRILRLETGQHHAVVQIQVTLKDNTTRKVLAGWGTARHGQLGSFTPVQATLGIPTMIPPPKGTSNADIASISLGSQHTLCLHTDGRVTSLGTNRKGQIEGLTSLENIRKIGCTWNGSFIMTDSSSGFPAQILSTGSIAHGQLGSFSQNGDVLQLQPVRIPPDMYGKMVMACGSEHVLVLLHTEPDGAEVWGWGWNEHGNLGLGNTDDIFLPTKIWPKTSSERIQVHGIWAGCGTTWISCTNIAS
ncbi:RCC1/BLIP-II [Pluteus cervinus]|uniref:RCC1/BLIP-II n=1 Tax=Pluteus cervinus TaxID=181527 RepID=A0ACD3A4N2_9AGAR|nr:RCC1/BLIP-II [Pluteus cervinus]